MAVRRSVSLPRALCRDFADVVCVRECVCECVCARREFSNEHQIKIHMHVQAHVSVCVVL